MEVKVPWAVPSGYPEGAWVVRDQASEIDVQAVDSHLVGTQVAGQDEARSRVLPHIVGMRATLVAVRSAPLVLDDVTGGAQGAVGEHRQHGQRAGGVVRHH